MAIPTVILCGPLLSVLIARIVPVGAPAYAGGVDTTATRSRHPDVTRPPSFGITLATILFPVALMLSKALADIVWNATKNPPMTRTVLDFIGEPLVAMTLAVLLAMVTFGYAVGLDGPKLSTRIGASVGPVAAVILIVGPGAGSLFLSHVNDAGFWLVKESFGLTVGETFKSWSVMETAVSVVALGFIMGLPGLM